MKVPLIALVFFVGVAAGAGAAAFLLRSRPPDRVPGNDPTSGLPEADLRARLEAAESKLRDLEKAPAADAADRPSDPSGPASTPAVDVAARLAELRSWIPTLNAKRDGKALIRLLRDLAALGPAGYESAIEVYVLLDPISDYGLDWGDMSTLLRGHTPAFLKWAIEDPSRSPPEFRLKCVDTLRSVSVEDPGPYFADLLLREKDAQTAFWLASELTYDVTPEMAPQLEELARLRAAEPSTVSALMWGLRDAGAPGESALERLAAESDPVLSEEAAVVLAGLRTEVKGWLVEDAREGPVRRGDVVVSVDGVPATHSDQVKEALKRQAPGTAMTLVVRRGGQELKVTVDSETAPKWGRMVQPAGTEE